jgi:membrane associated rhomboid family serine protease
MNGHRNWGSSEEHQPVTWFRGYGIYAAHLVVVVLACSMVVTALASRFGLAAMFTWFPFVSERVLQGEIWRVLTYGVVNAPSLQFVIDMVLIVWFGREVEKHFGRNVFLWLYAGLYLVTPLVLTVIGLGFPMTFAGATGALAVFTAFATTFPSVTVMFGILAKWAAIILVGTFSLIHFTYQNEAALFSLWATNLYAFLFIRYHQGRLELPRIKLWKRKPRLHVLPDLPPKKPVAVRTPKEDSTMAEVDALLDKIATNGISSLTAKERAKLEAAREDLMKRGAGRG